MGELSKRGAGALAAWHTRWFALERRTGTLRYFLAAPDVVSTVRLACPLAGGATLRVHEASYLMSLALGAGRVVQLKAATREQLGRWAGAFARGGAAVDPTWLPATLPQSALRGRQRRDVSVGYCGGGAARGGSGAGGGSSSGSGGGASVTAAGRRRWRVVVPGVQVLSDSRGAEYAAFTIDATRLGTHDGFAPETAQCLRRHNEFVKLSALVKQALGGVLGATALPALPATRRLGNKLEERYLETKRKAYQEYLQAVAALAQPDMSPDGDVDGEHAAAVEALRATLSSFVRGGSEFGAAVLSASVEWDEEELRRRAGEL